MYQIDKIFKDKLTFIISNYEVLLPQECSYNVGVANNYLISDTNDRYKLPHGNWVLVQQRLNLVILYNEDYYYGTSK